MNFDLELQKKYQNLAFWFRVDRRSICIAREKENVAQPDFNQCFWRISQDDDSQTPVIIQEIGSSGIRKWRVSLETLECKLGERENVVEK